MAIGRHAFRSGQLAYLPNTDWDDLITFLLDHGSFQEVAQSSSRDRTFRSDHSGLTLSITHPKGNERALRGNGIRGQLFYESEIDFDEQIKHLIVQQSDPTPLKAVLEFISKEASLFRDKILAHEGHSQSPAQWAISANELAMYETSEHQQRVAQQLEIIFGKAADDESQLGVVKAIESMAEDWLFSNSPQLTLGLTTRQA
jgi:hypothetical protein